MALTRKELIIVGAVLGLMLIVLGPNLGYRGGRGNAKLINCANNLKAVGMGFRIYANDNNETYPMRVPAEKGGAMEASEAGDIGQIFRVLSNELAVPKSVMCPADSRTYAMNWRQLSAENISYSVGIDATDVRPNMVLLSDRDIAEYGLLLGGTANLTANRPVVWHKLLHKEGGNIAFADGSVQQTTTATLRSLLANTGNVTNRVLFPQ